MVLCRISVNPENRESWWPNRVFAWAELPTPVIFLRLFAQVGVFLTALWVLCTPILSAECPVRFSPPFRPSRAILHLVPGRFDAGRIP
jgi:hypothetical protein